MSVTHKSKQKALRHPYDIVRAKVVRELAYEMNVTEQYVRQCVRPNARLSETGEKINTAYKKRYAAIQQALTVKP
jgi:hypothetical protein